MPPSEKLRPILDMLVSKAWRNAAPDQKGDFLLRPSDIAPGTTVESLHDTLQVLYKHARRWAPGLEIPFFVPPIRLDVTGAAGDFVVDEESYASVGVAAELVGDAAAVSMILSHEACHHILMQSGLKRKDDQALDEITTDLAMFVCGFGELVLRGHSHVPRYGRAGARIHLGYLSSDDYREVHDYVLAKRLAAGLPARSTPGADAASAPATVSNPRAADGTVEIWCGDAMCKRAFRAALRHPKKPWPVQCPACGIYLYPSDVLKAASAHELEPQRAELRMASNGGLAEVTSATLSRLARPNDASTKQLPASVDGAAILAEMIEAATQPAQAPAPAQRPMAPARPPARIPPALIAIAVIAIVLIAMWLVLSSR